MSSSPFTHQTVVIAGAAGFIGSHLAETLLKQDARVIGLDNFVTGSHANIELLKKYEQFSFHEHDISQPITIAEPVQYVMDMACPASPTDFARLRMAILKACNHGTYNLLELARQKQATFVFSSTSEVYGDPLEHPQKEDYRGNVNPIGPRSIYDEGKRFGEAMCMAFTREYDLKTRIVRIFNTYGERMRPDDGRAIPTFIHQALTNQDITVFGDGTQTRSPQYVSDLVRGILSLAVSDVAVPVNMGNPGELSIQKLAEMIVTMTGSQSRIIEAQPLPEDDPKVRQPDISRAKALLGWEPEVSLEAGLKTTIAWFKQLT